MRCVEVLRSGASRPYAKFSRRAVGLERSAEGMGRVVRLAITLREMRR